MLGQRRRRWATIGPALGQRLVFAGSVDSPHLYFAHHRCGDIKTVAQLIEPRDDLDHLPRRGPRVVVSTASFHARVRGSVPGPGGLKETQMFQCFFPIFV